MCSSPLSSWPGLKNFLWTIDWEVEDWVTSATGVRMSNFRNRGGKIGKKVESQKACSY